MVKVFVDPGFQVFEFAEVDDEAIGVGLAASKSQCDAPIMPVDQGAVSVVAVLAMGERDVAVGLFASKHFFRKGEGVKIGNSEAPFVGAQVGDVGCVVGVDCRVCHACQVEGFTAFDAGAAAATVQGAAFVARPCFFKG